MPLNSTRRSPRPACPVRPDVGGAAPSCRAASGTAPARAAGRLGRGAGWTPRAASCSPGIARIREPEAEPVALLREPRDRASPAPRPSARAAAAVVQQHDRAVGRLLADLLLHGGDDRVSAGAFPVARVDVPAQRLHAVLGGQLGHFGRPVAAGRPEPLDGRPGRGSGQRASRADHLVRDPLGVTFGEQFVVGVRVVAQPHPGVDQLPDQRLLPGDVAAHHAERGDGAVLLEDREDLRRPARVGAVVEGERDGVAVGEPVEQRRARHDWRRGDELDLHRRRFRRRGGGDGGSGDRNRGRPERW